MSTGDILFWAWALGWLWFVRYFIGWFFWDQDFYDADEPMMCFPGVILGMIAACFWPAVVPGRFAYRYIAVHSGGGEELMRRIFKAPREIPTREEIRRQRGV